MDSILMELTYEFVSNKTRLTWQELKYAIDRNFLPPGTAIEHALTLLSEDTNESSLIFELASLYHDEPVHTYLDELARLEPNQDADTIKEKWLYLILDWLFTKKDQYSDPFGLIEQIYADFDYPENIATFVRYMPMDGPDLGSIELNQARLYKNWEKYLDEQCKRFSYAK